MVNVSPQVGYRFNNYLAAGAGVTFLYSSFINSSSDIKRIIGVTGFNVFGRVYPIEYAFLQLQPELNYNWGKFKFDDGTEEKLNGRVHVLLYWAE